MAMMRSRWAAIGAAVAVTFGGGGFALVGATSPADAVAFVPITPCRVLDTRPAEQVGPRATPLTADETHTVDAVASDDAAGNCAGVIPATATAVSMNVTTVDAALGTFLTIWDGSDPRPLASSLNPAPGQPPTPNGVTTDLTAGGAFSIYNLAGSVHVLADITGYFTDHHHDDRYPTDAEIKERFDLTKSIEFDPYSMYLDSSATFERSAGNANSGVRLPGGETSSFAFTIVVPEDATPGTQLRIEILWHVNESGCSVALAENSTSGGRVGETGFSVPIESIPVFVGGPIETSEGRRSAFRTTLDGGFRPGDWINYGMFRSTAGDTCTGDAFINAARVFYD